jgi:hypothetical protein
MYVYMSGLAVSLAVGGMDGRKAQAARGSQLYLSRRPDACAAQSFKASEHRRRA